MFAYFLLVPFSLLGGISRPVHPESPPSWTLEAEVVSA
jgi:hypothetical protein